MATEALELTLHGLHIETLPKPSEYTLIKLSSNQKAFKIAVELEVKNNILVCPNVNEI